MTEEPINLKDAVSDKLSLALVKCFAIIALGYIAGRLGLIKPSECKPLNAFLGTFLLPSLIFTSLARTDLSLINWNILLAIMCAKIIVFAFVIVITLLISRPINIGRAAIFAIFATYSNDYAIGYPIIDALYGVSHPEYRAYLYLVAPTSLVILNPIGFIMLEIYKEQLENQSGCCSLLVTTTKSIVLNPILLMTALGIGWNLVFSHEIPAMLGGIVDAFGNSFPATALFLLGLMMVGKVQNLKGSALVIPGILISVKLLILPLMIREAVIMFEAGQDENEVVDLSTFGFIYGTLPTALALFVSTVYYNVEVDLIATAMVACTCISAPLMFVSAKLASAVSTGIPPADYTRQLDIFAGDMGAISTAVCCWLLVCFLVLGVKKYNQVTHRISLCLIIAQLMTSIGVIIWSKMEAADVYSVAWYFQFLFLTGGVYISRALTAVLAVTLLCFSCETPPVISKLQKWMLPIGCGLPFLIVLLMCILIPVPDSGNSKKLNPFFQLGMLQTFVAIGLLVFCFIVTAGCLVILHRYPPQSTLENYGDPTNPSISTDQRDALANDDLRRPDIENASRMFAELSNGYANSCIYDIRILETDREAPDHGADSNTTAQLDSAGDPQITRHLVLLILLLCSMFVGLALSISFLVMTTLSGVYAELAFLHVALTFGQSLIAFPTFGLDPGLGVFEGCFTKLGQYFRRTDSFQELSPVLIPHASVRRRI